jgi:hypothetical protein
MTIELIHEQAYKLIAAQLAAAGLRLEDNFRTSEIGFLVSDRAAAVMRASGCPYDIPAVPSLEGLGIKRSPFRHPLSDGDEKRGINFWFAASILISCALGWVPDEPPSPTAQQNIKLFVSMVAPTVDTAAMLKASRYSDTSLMRLTSLIAEAMEQAAEDDAIKNLKH